jgi:hypothetical protein
VYSYGEGWSRFHIVVNLARGICTLHRSLDADYSAMLAQLAGRPAGSHTPLPLAVQKVESLTFEVDILGYKMSRVGTGTFQPGGDWLVIKAFVPGSAQAFLVALSERLNAGELVIDRPESTPAVLHALTRVFG